MAVSITTLEDVRVIARDYAVAHTRMCVPQPPEAIIDSIVDEVARKWWRLHGAGRHRSSAIDRLLSMVAEELDRAAETGKL